MRSMTGFATKTATLSFDSTKIHITINIKSVNARFFESNCKLPYALHHLETDIIKVLKKQLYRGYIFFSINVSDPSALKGVITVSIPIAQSYIKAAKEIQDQTNIGGTFTLSDLIPLPYIFSVEEQVLDDQIKEQLFALLHETISVLIHEQEKEGSVLQDDLAQRIKLIQANIDEIEKLHSAFMANRKKEILDELQTYTTDEDVVIEARKAALYYLLDKIDIHEEIVRFKSHLDSFNKLIQTPSIEKGKRLDFTLQELLREINTIAAKCSDATMSALAIDIKVELEKAREQAQNIV